MIIRYKEKSANLKEKCRIKPFDDQIESGTLGGSDAANDDAYLDFDKIMAEIKAEAFIDEPVEDFRIEPDILPVFNDNAPKAEEQPLSFATIKLETQESRRRKAADASRKRTLTSIQSDDLPAKPVQTGNLDSRRTQREEERRRAETEKRRAEERAQRKAKQKQQKKAVKAEKKKNRSKLGVLACVMVVFWTLLFLYYIAAFSSIPFIKNLRTKYIQTALETRKHMWLANIFPTKVVDPIRQGMDKRQSVDVQSDDNWGKIDPVEPGNTNNPVTPAVERENITSEKEFYDLFWEIDKATMEVYLSSHPEALDNGWEGIDINEAGLSDDGTVIYTTMGEQVLAINVPDQILLVRVEGFGYQGVLAIAKDPAMLHNYVSTSLGYSGQCAGTIAQSYNGVLAINGSGFEDDAGTGNGGVIAGYTMADGVEYGEHARSGYKRIELHEDNLMYIKDAGSAVGAGTTDATEFLPALIVDGKMVVDENDFWNGVNPRAVIGQSGRYEILMLVIEGRNILEGVAGTGVYECAKILARHDCMQAMNLDGGATAIMWYDGEYVTHCSNGSYDGRLLPTAWVYTRKD
ncbi:MAG: phosphodiester glycosidase family protein [Clostridia bacterium]|nr:phosphodiester glycosidase family protein [Clostridia bacterium]